MNRNAFGLAFGATLAIALVCGVAAAQAPEEPVPPATVTDAPSVPLELPGPSADATAAPVTLPDLPPCPTEDSDGCYWDASEQGDGNGNDVVSQPVTEPEPEPEPEPDWGPDTVSPDDQVLTDTKPGKDWMEDNRVLTWDTGTLECGVNAKPAIDQDQYGNWWAYCEPALVD